MNKKIFLMLMFVPILAVSGFTNPNFPTDVPIGVNYGFEITYNDTSVEKCYTTVYNAGDEILKYYVPSAEKCTYSSDGKSIDCSPSKLYLENSGKLRFQFVFDMHTFQPDSSYYVVVDCGNESYNATVTTRTSQISNVFPNVMLFLRDNVVILPLGLILIGVLIYFILRIVTWLFRFLGFRI